MTVYRKHGPPASGSDEPEEPAALPADTQLARRYRVVKRLGAGGMGTVYEVFDQELEEPIALKILHADLSEDEEHRKRLRYEVRMARRVSHPNVCRVHDLGEHDGQLFVTMELIRGSTLRGMMRDLARGDAVPLPRKVDIVVQVCSALSAAHSAGVLHRDVKPDNVILERDRVVLTDFGVAGLVADMTKNRRVVAGTPAYIAPEVLRGEAYDQRVDVYATAVMAYELLAHQQPFATPNLDAAVKRARTRPALPPLPTLLAEPEVITLLDQALSRALDYDPAARTRSIDILAEEVSHAVRGHRRGGVLPPPADAEAATAATVAPQEIADAADQPTITAESVAAPGAPSVGQPTTGRAQLRVATALAFSCVSVHDEPARDHETGHTQPLTLLSAGDRFERVVVDLGGTPLEVSATGITALFGAPVTLGDDAARAARAAYALLARAREGRAAIDTGRMLYRRSRKGPSASGEAIQRAQALLGEAEPGEVLASPPAARQLAGRYRVSELADHRTADPDAGRALLIDAGTLDRSEVIDQIALLGRDRELASLESLVQSACETREPHWAALVGPAGYGKTRIRTELMRRVDERREVDWLVGHATPLGEVAPLSLLRSADPGWFDAASRGGLVDRRAAFAAARAWLEERAARRPVAVVFEDAQWADAASLELCDELTRTLEQLPVVMLLLGREPFDDRAAFAGAIPDGRREVIELGPLDTRSARELAHRIAPAASPDDLRELARRAGGNPFFVEELARDLRERGSSSSTHTVTSTTTTITPLPATVEAVVQGRLDRLPLQAREVASAAAVVGREFWREAVSVAMPGGEIDDVELDGVLAELEHRAIVAPLPPTAVDDERYVFSSELVRDVAYQQLSPRERRKAHAAVAAWLRPRVGPEGGADPAMLAAIATHCDLAGDTSGARAAYQAAGSRSMALFAYKEAAIALRRARELSPEPSTELLEQLGIALLAADSVDAGEEALLAALGRTTDELTSARILQSLSTAATRRADNDAAVEFCRRGLALLAPEGHPIDAARTDPTVLAGLYGSLGWMLGYVMTDNEVGLDYSARAVALLEHTPHKRELARALSRLGANYMRAGRWTDQLDCNRRNLAIGEQLGDLEMQLTAHINLGVTYSSMGRYEEAAEHTRRALDLARRTHAITTRALVHNNLGGWLLELGQLEEAEDHLRQAIELAERVGSRRFLPECYAFYARIALARGDLGEAEERARHGLALASSANVTVDEGISARVLGGVLTLRGALDEAQELLARSQVHLAEGDAYESAKTTAQTARFFALRDEPGDAKRARALRREASAVFERLGAARDLERLGEDREVR